MTDIKMARIVAHHEDSYIDVLLKFSFNHKNLEGENTRFDYDKVLLALESAVSYTINRKIIFNDKKFGIVVLKYLQDEIIPITLHDIKVTTLNDVKDGTSHNDYLWFSFNKAWIVGRAWVESSGGIDMTFMVTNDCYNRSISEQTGNKEKKIGIRFYTSNNDEKPIPIVQTDSKNDPGFEPGDLVSVGTTLYKIDSISKIPGFQNTNLKVVYSVLLKIEGKIK